MNFSFQHFRHQPNYAVLVDVRHRPVPQITYVVEENIEIIKHEVTHSKLKDATPLIRIWSWRVSASRKRTEIRNGVPLYPFGRRRIGVWCTSWRRLATRLHLVKGWVHLWAKSLHDAVLSYTTSSVCPQSHNFSRTIALHTLLTQIILKYSSPRHSEVASAPEGIKNLERSGGNSVVCGQASRITLIPLKGKKKTRVILFIELKKIAVVYRLLNV